MVIEIYENLIICHLPLSSLLCCTSMIETDDMHDVVDQ